MKKIVSLIVAMVFVGNIFGQDTLPKFTLAERSDRVTLSWTNPYQSLSQLNVQRSYDSLKNFTTIFSPTSPNLPQNGYTDVRPASNRYYYRIFYVLEGGAYFFTRSRRATGSAEAPVAAANAVKDAPGARDLTNGAFTNFIPGDKRIVTVKLTDTLYKKFSINAFRNFRDSVLRSTKDTLYPINDSSVGLSPYVAIEPYKASTYIYVNKDGFVNISLPQIGEKKYNVKFFEQDGTALFEIPNVRDSPLILDKANFVHAGWFLFELYEDNKLKEKNRFYVPKDF